MMEFFRNAEDAINVIFQPISSVIYYHIKVLAPATGLSENLVVWLTCTIASFIICLGLSHIEGKVARKIYSTFFGLFLGFYFNRASYIFILLIFIGVYLILLLPFFTRKYAAWLGTSFCFSILLILHLKYWL